MTSRLALGTVQFGLAYGITNRSGQVPEEEVRRILDFARASGISTLDTAALYGESEATLGRVLGGQPGFDIVTKTSKAQGAGDADEAVSRLRETFTASLGKLGAGQVYGLIAHEADDLIGPFGDGLWRAMESIRDAGQVRRIGASVYTGEQIDTLLDRLPLELVQIPFNALDKRLIEGGQLDRLRRAGVEVHCRSIFLQGLLIEDPARIPARFGPLAVMVGRLHAAFASHGLSPLEGLIASVLGQPQIDRLVVGVTRLGELEELATAERKAMAVLDQHPDFCRRISDIRIDDPKILSPALWGQLGGTN